MFALERPLACVIPLMERIGTWGPRGPLPHYACRKTNLGSMICQKEMGAVSQQTHDTPILNWILNFWVQDQYYLGSPRVLKSQSVLILMRILVLTYILALAQRLASVELREHLNTD